MSQLKSIVGGSKANRVGRDMECAMDLSHTAYAEHGQAKIIKLPVPTVYSGGGTRRLSERQLYDYTGSFGPNAGPDSYPGMYHGLSIAMEAKANEQAKASMAICPSTRTSGLSYHQIEALVSAYLDWGTVSVVTWMNGDQLMVLLPDAIVESKKIYDSGERKSIPKSMFVNADIVPYPNFPHVFDWLYVVRTWLECNGIPSPSLSRRRVYEMISYKLDISRRTIIVNNGDEKREFVTEILDRTYLDSIARESKDVEEFERRVKNASIANES